MPAWRDYRAAKMEIHQHSQHILINRDDPLQTPARCGPGWQSFGPDRNGYGRCELEGRHWLTLHGEPVPGGGRDEDSGCLTTRPMPWAAMALCDAGGHSARHTGRAAPL